MRRTLIWLVICATFLVFSSGTCFAQDASSFYKGKTILVLIPSGPGSGFDLVSRAIAPYLEKYTGAKTLLQNGKVGLSQNKLYRSKPDGLTVILSGHGAKEITAELFKQAGANYKWKEFTLLGRLPKSSTVLVVDKSKGWTTTTDLQGVQFFSGASSPFFGPLFAEACGLDQMEIIPGMKGSERRLAIRRGEIQATVAGIGELAGNEDIMQPIVMTNRDAKLPDVPSALDVAVKGKEKWARWVAAWDDVIYWSYATPGIPQERAAYLEQALEKTYNDPEFRAELEKLHFELSEHFVGAKELKELSRGLADLTDDEIAEMKYVINEKYQKK